MKCVKNIKTNKISRLSDELAEKFVKKQTHKYVPKEQWKKEVRDKS